ncbi:EF-P beta-lysylation protein EpmB [Sedimenticola selenatireducens]|uniref:EF-P beta-lysylation protein EpmB n=1 Tax=Sedimenticola selenatireducens TaxID=191960 RepID=UPI0004AC8C47|nr:EF-P beta-lysylation protein EpmB [Sedimenticola selenatireducens]
MIHRIEPVCQTPLWQQSLANAFSDVDAFIEFLRLDEAILPAARAAAGLFGLRVPREFAELIHKGDPGDPLLRQVLPIGAENLPAPGFVRDPVGDLDQSIIPGVLSKYQGRLLLIANGSCAVNCRYCFRRHYPYQEATAYRQRWQEALDHIHQAEKIDEIILSGGDPLTLGDGKLIELVSRLETIPHLKRLRIHTRLPVVIPSRLTPELTRLLTGGRLQPVLVLHINHAREISPELSSGLVPLKQAGVTLLNQSVLLKGVNDNTATLSALSLALFDAGILPYYLHLLDRVAGAAHFEVGIGHARQLQEELRAYLPGYLMPRMVREEAGAPAKQPVF